MYMLFLRHFYELIQEFLLVLVLVFVLFNCESSLILVWMFVGIIAGNPHETITRPTRAA